MSTEEKEEQIFKFYFKTTINQDVLKKAVKGRHIIDFPLEITIPIDGVNANWVLTNNPLDTLELTWWIYFEISKHKLKTLDNDASKMINHHITSLIQEYQDAEQWALEKYQAIKNSKYFYIKIPLNVNSFNKKHRYSTVIPRVYRKLFSDRAECSFKKLT